MPTSGILAGLPFTADYGTMFNYYDTDGSQPVLVMDHSLQTISIRLCDQFDEDLDNWIVSPTGAYSDFYKRYFSVPPWRIHLVIETI